MGDLDIGLRVVACAALLSVSAHDALLCQAAGAHPGAAGAHDDTDARLSAAIAGIETENLRSHVAALASDAFEGRGSGYPGEVKATDAIAGAFRAIGLEPAGDGRGGRRGYFQTFEFQPDGPVRPWEVLTSRNVLGFLEGADEKLRREIVVLGAHHDGQGRAGQAAAGRLLAAPSSRGADDAAANDDIWNSADDNASSVAVVLEVARVLADRRYRPRRSVVFATFGAEEHGLNGSVAYVAHPPFAWRRHVAMINLEKLGRIPGAQPITASSGTSPMWPELTARANRQTGMSVTSLTPDIISDTDHYPFAARGLPAIVIGMAHEEDTHQPGDSADKIAWDSLSERARYVLAILLDLADVPGRPRFTASPRRDPGLVVVAPTPAELEVLGRDAARGGVKVSGVIPGLPGARAGVRPGDLIVAVDGKALPQGASAREILESAVTASFSERLIVTVLRGRRTFEPVLEFRAR
jgi:hypothetical protein